MVEQVRAVVSLLGAVLVMTVVTMAPSSSAAPAAPGSGPLPLRSGQMGRYVWSTYAERPESAEELNAGYVCLSISMLEPIASGRTEGQASASCAPPPSTQPFTEYLSGGTEGSVRSVLAILFPADVQRVTLKTRGTPTLTIRAGHATLPGVHGQPSIPFAYAVKGLADRLCIEGIKGFAGNGSVVSSSGKQRCH